MPDFKNMIKRMEEKETPEIPTQEETEKAGKLADSGFKIGEHRFIGKDNNKTNPGFIAYGGNNPDQKLSTKELAKIYDEQQKAKNIDPEQDRLTKLKKDAIAESQATAKKEAPLAQKPKNTPWEDPGKRVKEADAKYKPIYDKMDKEDDEIYKAYWYETDPKKKAQLKAQLDEHSKKIDALIEEWEQAAGFGKKEVPLAQKSKTRKVGDEEFPAPQKAQYQESRFLKDDPYYKLIKEKSPMSYREYLYYPENGKFALHDTEGNKIGEFDDEENTLAAIDKRYSDKAGSGENNVAPTEPRLLKPTDTFTQKELDDYAKYLDSANGWDGWRIEKLPNGNYYGNITLGDPDEESIEITPAELAEVLKNDLISNPETAQDLYDSQRGNPAPSTTFNGMIDDMKEKEAREQPAREEGVAEKPTLEEQLGASRGMAGFLNSIDSPNNKYRVRYGYINEDDYNDESNSKVEDMDSYEAALKRYSDLNWLRDRDDKGRKFIRIETSGDGGKSYTGSLFSDAQKIPLTGKQVDRRLAEMEKNRKQAGKAIESKARKAWQEHLKYALADQTDENIEKGNRTAEEFGDIVWPYLDEKEKDEFDTIVGSYKDPQEVWDYLADVFGWQK